MYEDQLLLEVRPSWWNFFWCIVFFWLIIPLIVALWKRASLVLRIYTDRVILEKGILSKDIREIFISDIRTINVRQSLLQRIFKIGDIRIATAGTSGYEEVAYGMPDPKGIKELILRQRRRGTND